MKKNIGNAVALYPTPLAVVGAIDKNPDQGVILPDEKK